MKCRQFEHLLPEWLTEHLSPERAQQMLAHHASCPHCQRLAAAERTLRHRWQELPQSPELPGLWNRVAQRIDSVPQQRRSTLFPALAMGSALATICLFGLLMRPHAAINQIPVTAGQVRTSKVKQPINIVQMVNQVQELPEGESDAFFAETQQDRWEQRQAVDGKEGTP